jgi:hypothetical protein
MEAAMEKKTMRYPGDPDDTIWFMNGKEFKEKVREGKPGYLKVGPWDPAKMGIDEDDPKTSTIYFEEIICDLCNTEIKEEDQLAMNRSSAYCMACYEKNWKPWVV